MNIRDLNSILIFSASDEITQIFAKSIKKAILTAVNADESYQEFVIEDDAGKFPVLSYMHQRGEDGIEKYDLSDSNFTIKEIRNFDYRSPFCLYPFESITQEDHFDFTIIITVSDSPNEAELNYVHVEAEAEESNYNGNVMYLSIVHNPFLNPSGLNIKNISSSEGWKSEGWLSSWGYCEIDVKHRIFGDNLSPEFCQSDISEILNLSSIENSIISNHSKEMSVRKSLNPTFHELSRMGECELSEDQKSLLKRYGYYDRLSGSVLDTPIDQYFKNFSSQKWWRRIL